jgi:hypothetical protein
LSEALSLNHGTAPITREQLVVMVMRREIHPVRVTYELLLDHKNAKIRIDGARVYHVCFIHGVSGTDECVL